MPTDASAEVRQCVDIFGPSVVPGITGEQVEGICSSASVDPSPMATYQATVATLANSPQVERDRAVNADQGFDDDVWLWREFGQTPSCSQRQELPARCKTDFIMSFEGCNREELSGDPPGGHCVETQARPAVLEHWQERFAMRASGCMADSDEQCAKRAVRAGALLPSVLRQVEGKS